MKSLPKRIIRLDDGGEFVLNEKTNQYHLRLPFAESELGMFGYTYERLMEDDRCKGKFKISDGTENLMEMRLSWLKRVTGNNDGHGNENDDGC